VKLGDLVRLKGDDCFLALVLSSESIGVLGNDYCEDLGNVVSIIRNNKIYITYEADLELISARR
jgi:hypothetical protein